MITPGNLADSTVVDQLTKTLHGKLFEDKGYSSQTLSTHLIERGLQLLTTLRSNRKQKLMHLHDKRLLRYRAMIETVNDQLKNISQIEPTLNRSVSNFLVHLLAALAASSHQKKKPSLNLDGNDNQLLLVA